MRHDYALEAHGYRLRPVGLADADFIISLRADPVHARFLNPTSADHAAQIAYLERYFTKPDDYSFVLENVVSGRPEGLVALYDVDRGKSCSEWGRWILRPGSLGAAACAWLIYEIAFTQVGLHSVYCRTVEANTTVVAFHDQFGLVRRARLPGYFKRGEEILDSIEHHLDRARWNELRERHEPVLRRLHARATTPPHEP